MRGSRNSSVQIRPSGRTEEPTEEVLCFLRTQATVCFLKEFLGSSAVDTVCFRRPETRRETHRKHGRKHSRKHRAASSVVPRPVFLGIPHISPATDRRTAADTRGSAQMATRHGQPMSSTQKRRWIQLTATLTLRRRSVRAQWLPSSDAHSSNEA